MKMTRLLTLLLIILGLNTATGWSAEIKTKIKYVSAETVYLDAGSIAGISQGDSATIIRDGKVIADLVISFVAENSASASIVEATQALHVGDDAIVHAIISTKLPTSPQENLSEGLETPILASPSLNSVNLKRRSATRIRGRIGAQLFFQDDRESGNDDVIRPALVARTTIENLFTEHLNLRMNLRIRQIRRTSAEFADPQTEWNNRIYEFALEYDNPSSPLSYAIGRISSNQINGIGRFDGALAGYKADENVSFGAFAGTLPDLQTSEPGFDETAAGLYAAYEVGDWNSHKFSGTLALAGKYNSGEINKEFLYQQLRYSWTRKVSFYQSAEIDINRGWRETVEGSSISVSNVLVNATYSPVETVNIDFGYDNRKLVRTYETKDTPDSLFDDALRQGFRAGLSTRFPWQMRAWMRAGLSKREGESENTRTLSGGLSQRDIFRSGVTLSAQASTFENPYSKGIQPSLKVSSYLMRVLYLQAELGQSTYDLTDSGESISYDWLHLEASGSISRHFYSSAFTEFYRGDDMDVNRYWVELGYRF